MTVNRRIALNTIATYGRSMFGVVCGIFSTRWVLEALGQEDFGLYGVIAGMAIFVSFLNIQFSSALGRFYAISVGEAQKQSLCDASLEASREWFSTGVFIHTIFPLALVAIGYPIGIYAMQYGWLSIPIERLGDCIWLWRIVCITTFISMVNVPFQAMYVAKQFIAELTIYSFIQTIVRTMLIYCMTCFPGKWLVGYGWLMCATASIPHVIIAVRAFCVFQECRMRLRAAISLSRIWQLSRFAFWQAVGGIGFIASHQAMSIIVNNCYGARTAGAFAVSQTVSGEASSLTGALQSAFAPAITTVYGAGDVERARRMAFKVCKFGTLLTLMFGLPMMLEIDELLTLWLKNPPPNSALMCMSTIAFIAIEKLTCGHIAAVNASGQVAVFQALRGVLRLSVIPLALCAVLLGFSAPVAVVSLPLSAIIVDIGDVLVARSRIGMGARYWLFRIVLPIVVVAIIGLCIGLLPRCFLPMSFLRLVISTLVTLAAFGASCCIFALDSSERRAILDKVCAMLEWR